MTRDHRRHADAQFVQTYWRPDPQRGLRDGCRRCHQLLTVGTELVWCHCVCVSRTIADAYAGVSPTPNGKDVP